MRDFNWDGYSKWLDPPDDKEAPDFTLIESEFLCEWCAKNKSKVRLIKSGVDVCEFCFDKEYEGLITILEDGNIEEN